MEGMPSGAMDAQSSNMPVSSSSVSVTPSAAATARTSRMAATKQRTCSGSVVTEPYVPPKTMVVWLTPTLSMSFAHRRWRMSSSTMWGTPARSKKSAMSSTTPAAVPSAAPKWMWPAQL